MLYYLKHFIKKYLWYFVFRNKIYGRGITANADFIKEVNSAGFNNKELNVFTIANEDGIILNIFSSTGTANRRFADIGSNDCINSNCANLAFHHNWSGVFIDGSKKAWERGKYIYTKHFRDSVNKFSFINAVITTDNVNDILRSEFFSSETDLLCIDLDGNDYHIWESITSISPRVVVTEVQIEKGETEFIPEYTNDFEAYEDGTPKGASPLSMIKLAEKKGYSLAAVNKGCYNLFFVRNDCMKGLKKMTLDEAMKHR